MIQGATMPPSVTPVPLLVVPPRVRQAGTINRSKLVGVVAGMPSRPAAELVIDSVPLDVRDKLATVSAAEPAPVARATFSVPAPGPVVTTPIVSAVCTLAVPVKENVPPLSARPAASAQRPWPPAPVNRDVVLLNCSV